MVVYIIGLILLLIVLYIVGYFVKRKYYAYIDRLEAWKIDVMNRPVLDEVGKVKQLHMDGEAEEYFERWRRTWDNVVTVELPDVEEWLFDAEKYVDKYLFSKAKQVFSKIETTLNLSESKINEMVEKLRQIIQSEEKNREELPQLEELYKKLKKELLAHRHAFGKASEPLEKAMLAINEQMQQVNDETNKGNYLTARELVVQLQEKLAELNQKMENIPLLLNECFHLIPNQIKELKMGIKEMTEEGYNLEHLDIEKELKKIEVQLSAYIQFIESAEINDVSEGMNEIKESLEFLYDLLEGEVSAKKYVHTNQKKITESMTKISTTNEELKNEVDLVKISYHLSEEDNELVEELDRKITTMKKTIAFLLTENELPHAAFSVIKEKIEELVAEVTEIESKQQIFKEMLQALRKDEFEAREKIKNLRAKIHEATRQVNRSNIPGIPDSIETEFMEAHGAIRECVTYLEEKPLVMASVRESLEKADTSVNHLYEQVVEMIENVYLIEKIIQYGNRYRKQSPATHKRLNLAEEAFRRYDYNQALEEAAAAVEDVEPGAIKRIEELINEEYGQQDPEKK